MQKIRYGMYVDNTPTRGEHCAKYLKFCGNCVFPQNFYTRKLGEITIFYAVESINKVKKLMS